MTNLQERLSWTPERETLLRQGLEEVVSHAAEINKPVNLSPKALTKGVWDLKVSQLNPQELDLYNSLVSEVLGISNESRLITKGRTDGEESFGIFWVTQTKFNNLGESFYVEWDRESGERLACTCSLVRLTSHDLMPFIFEED